MVILNKKTLTGAIKDHETSEPKEEDNNSGSSCSEGTCSNGACCKKTAKDKWDENS